MPPSTSSHSPTRRKRVSRRASASAVSGSRVWATKPNPYGSIHATLRRPTRRDSSPSPSIASLVFSNVQSEASDIDAHPHTDDELSTRTSDPFPPLDDRPLTYASLPPTPISTSPHRSSTPPPVSPQSDVYNEPEKRTPDPPFSLWDYLREELLATDFDSHQELKWERVSNFLSMPIALEKIFFFGFILCFDSFLYTFTILPIRFILALARLLFNLVFRRTTALPPSQKADILKTLLLIISIVILGPLTDASKIYHSIRGQDTIKLYVIFNALEIADRLCASIGQDILDCMFSRSTLEVISHRKAPTSHTLRPLLYFILALIYNVSHTLVMIYQMISLNVAVNSYDHALLTLLVSNQFVEIKGSVFKKFEKDNLFQITCADIVERFTLALMLAIVAFRNLIELSGASFNFSEGFTLPKSFGWFTGHNVLWTISSPVVTVLVSEMLVDWLKHAFIAKFNHIRPSVYERYTDVLCQDLACGSAVGRRRKHTYVDQSPLVARRLGFASLPLAVLAVLIGTQSINLFISMHTDDYSPSPWDWGRNLASYSTNDMINVAKWAALGLLFWICTLVIKIIMGVHLLGYATKRQAGMEARAAADVVNDFGRDPIGEGKEEQVRSSLSNPRYAFCP
ncbi:DUF747-domain-containing protein [Panus rudis PR-1116 ss-1]|nr:DUF747-domain-containing protein [Panus rudis PR-1116 ss-1]